MHYRPAILSIFFFSLIGCDDHSNIVTGKKNTPVFITTGKDEAKWITDTALFKQKLISLANNDSNRLWPAPMPYPLAGALLPFNRIIAFYGNIYDKEMGILGKLPKKELINKLQGELNKWSNADPATPLIPAFHCVTVEKWDEPNTDSKLRNRNSFAQIDTLLSWSHELKGLVFLDLQVGNSSLQEELPLLEKYLLKENVHLGIDPEFSIKKDANPADLVGSFNYDDINYAIEMLRDIVRKYHLPPKILVVHRFTENMVKGFEMIKKIPEVQVVIDMDGFGDKAAKTTSYYRFVYQQPVEFTGFKLFYKYDRRNGSKMMTPEEVLELTPKPVYVQYE